MVLRHRYEVAINIVQHRRRHRTVELLAGRMNAVNREFVYIDFDDERFPPCEMIPNSGKKCQSHNKKQQSLPNLTANLIMSGYHTFVTSSSAQVGEGALRRQ